MAGTSKCADVSFTMSSSSFHVIRLGCADGPTLVGLSVGTTTGSRVGSHVSCCHVAPGGDVGMFVPAGFGVDGSAGCGGAVGELVSTPSVGECVMVSSAGQPVVALLFKKTFFL